MKNIVYKFTTIKTGVLVEKSWSKDGVKEGDNEYTYYDREQDNYAFDSYTKAADWLKVDANVQTEA